MWDQPPPEDDPFLSPQTISTTTLGVAYQLIQRSKPRRFSTCSGPHHNVRLALVVLGIIWFVYSCINATIPPGSPTSGKTSKIDRGGAVDVDNEGFISPLELVLFQPPSQTNFGEYRHADIIDTFAEYKSRDACDLSSLDLHAAFDPLCGSREEMLEAMAGGGRIGMDGRFMPRRCDMRWFSSEEVCEILGRFDRVLLVGDSMLRHVIGSINILIRKDLGYGAVTDWNFSMREREDCFCNEQFDVKSCSVQGIYSTADVLAHNPQSLSCSNIINVIMEEIVKHPIPNEELSRLQSSLVKSDPMSTTKLGIRSAISTVEDLRNKENPIAIVFGHGLWSNLEMQKTMEWFDTILETITNTVGTANLHGLFVTPNAAGRLKPDEWIVTQGNKALSLFEEAVGAEVRERSRRIFADGKGSLEHLGTWNMSIQARTYDGVHLDMRGNLVKAMMVMNWLAML